MLVTLCATLLVISTFRAKATELTEADINAAKKLYLAKCAKCHKLYDPAGYRDAEWHSWMTKMAKKARLKQDQAELLSRYLDTMRARQKPSKNKTNS